MDVSVQKNYQDILSNEMHIVYIPKTKFKIVTVPSHCLYIIYLTEVVGIEFESAVLNLYYQRFS